MRKIVLDLAVTLDGFIEGPNGEIDWCIMDGDIMDGESGFGAFLNSIDTIFYGRVSYDLWGQFQPDSNAAAAEQQLWKTVHSKKKYVFSHQPKDDGKATYIHGDIAAQVAAIKQQPGKNIWLYGGGKLITTFIAQGLIDVYRLAVHPVLLGEGKPLFSGFKNRVGLSLINSTSHKSGVVLLEYAAVK